MSGLLPMSCLLTHLDLHLFINAAQVLEFSVVAPPSKISGIEHVAPVTWMAVLSSLRSFEASGHGATHPSFLNGSSLYRSDVFSGRFR